MLLARVVRHRAVDVVEANHLVAGAARHVELHRRHAWLAANTARRAELQSGAGARTGDVSSQHASEEPLRVSAGGASTGAHQRHELRLLVRLVVLAPLPVRGWRNSSVSGRCGRDINSITGQTS